MKVLVATPNLNSGGVEVSLVRFINELSKRKDVKIDLLLLEKTGLYLDSIPNNVNIIEIEYTNKMYRYNGMIKDIKSIKGLINKIRFFFYRYKLKKYQEKNDYFNYYQEILKHVKLQEQVYDLAIDYHGYGHFISAVVSKINAKKRAMWIHDEKNEWLNKIEKFLPSYDKIFCVGEGVMQNVIHNMPQLKDQCEVFYNMTDYKNIIKKANMKADIMFDKNVLNIVTIGRLEWQKAYDVAIEIAYQLKEEKIKFCWYAIGGGTKEKELKQMVIEKNLQECFVFLGVVSNPFPLLLQADMFVLPSRHEGYCLSTLEAKILKKVIVATDILSNQEQISNGINGFLCKLDAKEFASTIIKVSKDKKLMEKVKDNLSKENFDNTCEFMKLDKLMEDV